MSISKRKYTGKKSLFLRLTNETVFILKSVLILDNFDIKEGWYYSLSNNPDNAIHEDDLTDMINGQTSIQF